MDISQVQVVGRESLSPQFYNLCYLPIEYSKVKQTLDDWKSTLQDFETLHTLRELHLQAPLKETFLSGTSQIYVATAWRMLPSANIIMGNDSGFDSISVSDSIFFLSSIFHSSCLAVCSFLIFEEILRGVVGFRLLDITVCCASPWIVGSQTASRINTVFVGTSFPVPLLRIRFIHTLTMSPAAKADVGRTVDLRMPLERMTDFWAIHLSVQSTDSASFAHLGFFSKSSLISYDLFREHVVRA